MVMNATSLPGGESGYEPAYPDNIPTESSVKRFITNFFAVSDTPDSIDEWVSYFRDDATVIMGNDIAKGKQEIRKLRLRMWKDVEERKHRLVKVFPGSFNAGRTVVAAMNEAEFMLFGAVAYRLRNGGGDSAVDWAGHARLFRDKVTSQWRFGFYRVYLQR
ncbi:hypothetical protein MFIFM68171_10836 [Madurella fahalii]|uniref:SnoaL-like domain-containing protein n=1 Tax=Madurella fahalii TaxID=1157608 RepID=A0ABQ0GSB6_9PEZI